MTTYTLALTQATLNALANTSGFGNTTSGVVTFPGGITLATSIPSTNPPANFSSDIVANNFITTGNVQSNTVTTNVFTSITVTSNVITSITVTSNVITSNTIVVNKITSKNVTTNTISSGYSSNIAPTITDVNGNTLPVMCGAWARFSATPSTVTINASYNISSITYNAAGDYTINFINPFLDGNYAMSQSSYSSGDSYTRAIMFKNGTTPYAANCRITNSTGNVGQLQDSAYMSVMFFR
jgi:hypothetical protein